MSPAHSTPVNRRLDQRQLSIQMARAPQRNSRRTNSDNNGEHGSYSFTVQTPNGPSVRLRVNLNVIAVDQQPRQPRIRIRRPIIADDDEQQPGDDNGHATRSRSSRSTRVKPTCNHALDRKFCSKCHIRRRHLNRWWLRQQYRQH